MKKWVKILLITLALLIILCIIFSFYHVSYPNIPNMAQYGQSPNINSTECSDQGGEIKSLGCKNYNDFLGTVTGVKCKCVCCKK